MARFDITKKKNETDLHKSIKIAEEIWNAHKDILYCTGYFFRWQSKVYEKIDDIDWMILMSDRFPSINEMSPRSQREIMEVYKRFAKTPLEKFNCEDGLCFENKYLDFSDVSVHDHNKKRINTIIVPYNYDPKAKCALWEATIKDIFENDMNKVISLQEFFGYCLTRDTSQEKAMFLFGEGATGKSVVLETLQNMIGKDNASFVSLKHFSDSMRISTLQNKLINISTEVPKHACDYEEIYKKIASGEYIDVNPKYIPPFSFRPFCKMIFAINEWPHIDDKTFAFFRRMLIIDFNKIYSEDVQDKILKKKLITELPGILNWAIRGLARIKEKNSFTQSEYMKNAIREVKLQNNPAALFVSENLEVVDGERISKQVLYKTYAAWCNVNGYKVLGSAKFGTEIYRIFNKSTKRDARRTDGDRDRVWENTAIKKPWEDKQEAIDLEE